MQSYIVAFVLSSKLIILSLAIYTIIILQPAGCFCLDFIPLTGYTVLVALAAHFLILTLSA